MCHCQTCTSLAVLASAETRVVIGQPRIERRSVPATNAAWPVALHPVLRRVYAARGIVAPDEIEHRLAALLKPSSLGGIERACELLEAALRANAPILIVGDFDADGATGTAVAVRGLRLLGARRVDYGVPNRFTHGYGLSVALVDELLAQRPDLKHNGLLITVDNGVAAHAGVAAAKAQGLRVIVTDHHLPGETLPDADAMVNPNAVIGKCGQGSPLCDLRAHDARLNAEFPSKALAGVGVIFYLLLALRAHLRERGWFVPVVSSQGSPLAELRAQDQHAGAGAEPDLSCLLDLVALGTVADLVALDRNNRILVEAGLKRIRAGRACPGIVALLESGKRDPARAIASDLGFVVAPRINAAGRLEDIRLGIECLLSDDLAHARSIAERLSAINSERRELQSGMVEQAEASVQKWILQHGADSLPVGIVLFEPDWHHGVVGLVASRLKETLHRPVIACAPAGDGSIEKCVHGRTLCDLCDQEDRRDTIKASGRSISGFHLRDALAEIDARMPGLLLRFGGHAMAAGMTLRRVDIARFAQAFDDVARARLAAEQLDAILYTDGELSAADFTLDLAQQLRIAGPWGQAYPEPLFDGVFAVESWRIVGENHWRLRLRLADSDLLLEAMQFNVEAHVPPPARVRAVFHLDVNDWNGTQSLRLLIRHLRAI
jgi:single-stranded-DNA-specific exonuclease